MSEFVFASTLLLYLVNGVSATRKPAVHKQHAQRPHGPLAAWSPPLVAAAATAVARPMMFPPLPPSLPACECQDTTALQQRTAWHGHHCLQEAGSVGEGVEAGRLR